MMPHEVEVNTNPSNPMLGLDMPLSRYRDLPRIADRTWSGRGKCEKMKAARARSPTFSGSLFDQYKGATDYGSNSSRSRGSTQAPLSIF